LGRGDFYQKSNRLLTPALSSLGGGEGENLPCAADSFLAGFLHVFVSSRLGVEEMASPFCHGILTASSLWRWRGAIDLTAHDIADFNRGRRGGFHRAGEIPARESALRIFGGE
jgi:hypothetical protein